MSDRQVSPAQQGALAIKRSLEQMATQFRDALPSHITPERFQRVVLTVVNMSPDLARADKTSLLSACMKCAADGLVPDGRDAALVVFGGKVQYMPMYAGLMRRARNSGAIASISAHVVHEKDHFTYRLGDDEAIDHRPAIDADRGKMIAVYAIARFKDGSIQREVLTAAEVERVKKSSRSSGNGPWVQWPDQMWRKTAIRRLSKYLPLDADMEKLVRRDDEIEREAAPSVGVTLDHNAGVDEFEAAASGVIDAESTVVDSVATIAAPEYIEAVEASATENELDKAINLPAMREAIKAMSADDRKQCEIAVQAQRRGFKAASEPAEH